MTPAVSVVIPIFNAAGVLEASVERLAKVLGPREGGYEILLKDDGSHDGSREILAKVAQRHEHITCSSNGSNKGLGSTLKALFQEARGDIVIYCDIDLPFGEGIISRLLDEVKGHDIAVASRYAGGRNRVPFLRKIASRLYYVVCRMLFSITVVDIGSGSVALTRRAVRALDLKSRGFAVHAEIYVQASRQGLRVKEFPASSNSVGLSSFRIARHGFGVIKETVRIWLEHNRRVHATGE